MKKLFILCVAISIATILILISWSVYHSQKGFETVSYNRFHKENVNGETSFNWLALLSPVQVEAQKKSFDTIRFKAKVPYPLAPKFKMITPLNGDMGEKFVAEEIVRIIKDSLSRISIQYGWNYDRKSEDVRRYKRPQGLLVENPKIDSLHLLGTASPEATKYGLKESMMPGAFEPENLQLSYDRLERTANLLENMGYIATKKDFTELQFTDTAEVSQALLDPSILDEMRYVEASVVIPIQRMEVKTLTSPVLLMFWFLLSGFLINFLMNINSPMRSPRTARTPNKPRRSRTYILDILRPLLYVIIIISLIIIAIIFLGFYWLIGIFIPIIILIYWFFRKSISTVCRYFTRWVSWNWSLLVRRWRRKTSCQKVLFFVIPYSIGLTIMVLYLWTKIT